MVFNNLSKTADDLCGNLNYTTTLPRSRKSSQSGWFSNVSSDLLSDGHVRKDI